MDFRDFNVITLIILLYIFRYELLYGTTPFNDENTYTLYEKILNKKIEFPDDIPISDAAKDLILRLLNRNQDKRLGAEKGIKDILKHQFFADINIRKMINQEVFIIK